MGIALTVKYSIQEETENRQSYDLKVEVTNAVDVSDKIFVFQRKVLSSTDAQANRLMDQFVSLADPVDLEEFPEDSPNLDANIPFFRKNTVLLSFRSMTGLEETKDLIDQDVTALVQALKASETLIEDEIKIYD